jgi:hypothetical protein
MQSRAGAARPPTALPLGGRLLREALRKRCGDVALCGEEVEGVQKVRGWLLPSRPRLLQPESSLLWKF